jgi:hypothetical protein
MSKGEVKQKGLVLYAHMNNKTIKKKEKERAGGAVQDITPEFKPQYCKKKKKKSGRQT